MRTQLFPPFCQVKNSVRVIVNNTHRAAEQTLALTNCFLKTRINHSAHVFKGPQRLLKHIHNLSACAGPQASPNSLQRTFILRVYFISPKSTPARSVRCYGIPTSDSILADKEVREIGECRCKALGEDARLGAKIGPPVKKIVSGRATRIGARHFLSQKSLYTRIFF